MTSKTPKFDAALDEYFSKLELDEKGGQWRVCRFSGEKFYVRPEDVEFYKKMRVPLPTLSPGERFRLMLASWNSYFLFNTTSAFSGKKIVTQFPPNTQYKVYEHQHWFSGNWDAIEYGTEYNSGKNFFDQFKELKLRVPRPSLFVDNTNVNSDYTNDSVYLKDCYLVFNSNDSENCHYSIGLARSKDCFDVFDVFSSTICYECFESFELYNCFFVEYSKNCLDSYFLYNCRNCINCFGGINLRNKKYIFFGEQLTKDEYDKKFSEINLGERGVLKQFIKKFEELKRGAIHRPNHNEKSVNVHGDYITNSKNCHHSYFAEKSENSAYLIGTHGAKECYDVTAIDAEFCNFCGGVIRGYRILFSEMVEDSHDLEYSNLCFNCHDIFGCIGLRNKSFCIFNKQYEEDEYWKIVDGIKTKMLKDGEYGEYFTPKLSPFPYNISLMASYKGYDNIDVAQKLGYWVEDVKEEAAEIVGDIIDSDQVPENINDTNYDILNKIIFDRKNNKKFRYTKAELDFHKKYNIALPIDHFTARLKEKRDKFGSIVLEFFERVCPKCGKNFEAVYRQEDPRIVYCESCYLKEIV
ncbi:hypothetical protein A3I27_00190 [Candidatus Giovannonibacteria bacterium RIFCSPLOWO2_02_FULL_43_11b]|uniref:Uncharacterized protein n=1 Tax=Candidatus Giovannonibacteria bacterium RIFCSPHIGHO2_12_FULL_43_15 TaxID=1798341 RepID=A0A1F5WQI7_9BACT|nr:MAG: hypothetical protein A2739_02225 [Candidatus Giovannonibacteria bacterium RIFCSPHIGHO2_01_FULL_43_100]OGF67003.1 MAG: hypothetical protein A3B97_00180 [Candidatus Giovannonibacteria bacterium RIFCSPHIGHO2_02_FULL_43_32]OGF77925.1 MAG: hypothetical protein A3F23_04305 [Candidatus Giovannonibacteria bacterium RIFCSPHIGHO2_12_FULL_43_15]OGF78700.1 MAG: hypothetical protein A3A15_01980 [Candidatus Giovannonibacteria bacterium RIFCSPLOWO2_01_FULL_43_60]OGF89401.1 MAG: hypothetical protein A3